MRRGGKLTDLFKFAKPKTIGYEISRDAYLSILCSTTQMPSVNSIAHPKGNEGAVIGFIAPLLAKMSRDLNAPLERGVYGVASLDQKTMLKLMVMPVAESGFDPEVLIKSPHALKFSPDVITTIRSTWHVAQLNFEAFDPKIAPALDLYLNVAERLALLTDGIIADPISHRYLQPDSLQKPGKSPGEIPVVEHVSTAINPSLNQVFTRGLIKFAMPEHEILDVPEPMVEVAERFLLGVAQAALNGKPPELGISAGAPGTFLTCAMTRQRSWEGMPVYEWIPAPGTTLIECLTAWDNLSETKRI